MVDIIYKDQEEFNSMGNNYNFKQKIFYIKYKYIGLWTNNYIYVIFIMLSGQTQLYYYINYGNIFIFD